MKQKQEKVMPNKKQTFKAAEAAARRLIAWMQQVKSDEVARAAQSRNWLPFRSPLSVEGCWSHLKHEMSQL
jgi:hypothetical protein